MPYMILFIFAAVWFFGRKKAIYHFSAILAVYRLPQSDKHALWALVHWVGILGAWITAGWILAGWAL